MVYNDELSQFINTAPQITLEDCFKYTEPSMFLEFGVATGASLRRIANKVTDIVWGFDSWEGLPEALASEGNNVLNWKGEFRCPPPTNLPANVRLVTGLFQDTLPDFLKTHGGPVSFVHMDADLYSSTKFVLDQLKDRLDRAVVVFDEITGHPVYEDNEGRAFREFLAETGYKIICLGSTNPVGTGAAFKLFRE